MRASALLFAVLLVPSCVRRSDPTWAVARDGVAGDGTVTGAPASVKRASAAPNMDGKLDDPNFRLNEGFSTRVASSLGDVMGVSVEGLAKGAGSLGQKGVEAAGGAVEGVGKAVKGIFGK